MIEVRNLVKKYGGHLAVDNLNFTVEKGQIYGFLGPNGAGKSTTMNIITGYIASTEGTVTVDGHDILEEPEAAKKCIGYLPEQPPLYFDMTVTEYLSFVAELKQVEKPKRKEMIQEVMEMTGITDVSGRVIKNLSKGYRQRVGLAQALIGFPEILILDEPTVGLDPKQMIEIRELIKSLSKNHTVILSSHILSEVSAVCDYIMIISKGKLVASDTPENLSKAMAGAQKLSLLVKGSTQEVETAIGCIRQVSSFCCEGSEQEGVLKVSLEAEQEADVREEVFFAMADRKLPILEMMTTSMSLEDVFLELTDGGEESEKLEEEENHAGDL
ncbi:ABC transporter ATP-binding protein [Qiania dongpingensis]|uniref:ATP-binding cassette domain-containing protein n=1 Tax=Qiania dongpingensis TaxID=2763669 RepID=A0A7G9G159_9FIRM|nr:ATP-binding cassette domain-containing protein [Qiania dongpingensis]QNM04541.1 ATP-binding cassette domain-containing protein [Qiania dongpingensis]